MGSLKATHEQDPQMSKGRPYGAIEPTQAYWVVVVPSEGCPLDGEAEWGRPWVRCEPSFRDACAPRAIQVWQAHGVLLGPVEAVPGSAPGAQWTEGGT